MSFLIIEKQSLLCYVAYGETSISLFDEDKEWLIRISSSSQEYIIYTRRDRRMILSRPMARLIHRIIYT